MRPDAEDVISWLAAHDRRKRRQAADATTLLVANMSIAVLFRRVELRFNVSQRKRTKKDAELSVIVSRRVESSLPVDARGVDAWMDGSRRMHRTQT